MNLLKQTWQSFICTSKELFSKYWMIVIPCILTFFISSLLEISNNTLANNTLAIINLFSLLILTSLYLLVITRKTNYIGRYLSFSLFLSLALITTLGIFITPFLLTKNFSFLLPYIIVGLFLCNPFSIFYWLDAEEASLHTFFASLVAGANLSIKNCGKLLMALITFSLISVLLSLVGLYFLSANILEPTSHETSTVTRFIDTFMVPLGLCGATLLYTIYKNSK